MRIALLSDIHGNSVALTAALNDIKGRGSVDAYWVLGDLCAIGYDPIGVLEQLNELPNLTAIKGNADRYVTTTDMPPPSIESAKDDPDLIAVLVEVHSNFHWTRGALDGTGWTPWLRDLPFDVSHALPSGQTAYLVHSAPGTDEGKGLNPARTDDELMEILSDVDASLICVGHFHLPLHRHFRDLQIINPGSVSNTFHKEGYAYYAILSVDQNDFEVSFYAVKYDMQQAIDMARNTLNIGTDYNIYSLSGHVVPSWKQHWDGVSYFPEIVMD